MSLAIYELPKSTTFQPDAAGRNDLQKALDHAYRFTRVAPPNSPRDVRLDYKTRRTQSGCRYISSALFRVCRVLSPGLSNTVVSLAAPARAGDVLRDQFSTQVACTVFNQVVDLRYAGLLSQSQLIFDENQKTIEGLLGPKTHFFENGSFVELVESVLSGIGDIEFAGASLVGRRIFLRYLRPETVHTVVGSFRYGYAFCATEAGDDAVRCYLMYQRTACGSCCLESPSGRLLRQRRTGTRFIENIKRLLARLLSDQPHDLPRELEQLVRRKVFGAVEGRAIERTLANWRRRFKLAGMPADMANSVTARLLGRDQVTSSVMMPDEVAGLTEYQLLQIAMDESRRRSQRLRELAERATFTVFFGDVA